jgi:RecB family exonuclease
VGEAEGARPLEGLAHPFTVTARADRIDRDPAGRYAIYDYKSGGLPSAREAARFHLQLPLEAAIAEAGGFAGLPPGPAFHLELLGVGARRSLALAVEPATVWARLAGLIAAYQDPAEGFVARLRPQKLTWAGDYDHLSRLGEWADGDAPLAEPVA